MEKNSYEKTKMASYVIPLCGFICAAAVILAALLIAAYAGAFGKTLDTTVPEGSAEFSAPSDPTPSKPQLPEPIDEDPAGDVFIYKAAVKVEPDSFDLNYIIDYDITLQASGGREPLTVTSVKCSIYSGAEYISAVLLADEFTIITGSGKQLSGTAIAGAHGDGIRLINNAVIYVEWEDEDGRRGSTAVAARVVRDYFD
ncbi:MAG: hypothetical protein J5760_00125 [Clostridia bacterium]|nr:hypothetical protein [Clostridia bacterium]